MATVKNQFIIQHRDGFGGNMVDSQYLGASYQIGKPYVFENTLAKIFSSTNRFFTAKPLLAMTGANKFGMKEIPTEIYRWVLQGAEKKAARSLGQLDTTIVAPGLNNSTFRIWLDLDYFAKPDVLIGEDNDFQCEIVDGPIPYGGGFVYVVRLQGDSPEAYLPIDQLEAGKEFTKEWTTIQSEYNQDFGTQQYPNSFMLESQVSFFGQKFDVTDKAWREEGRLEFEFLYTDARTGQEKRVNRFLPMAEAKMHDELYMSMEKQMLLGKKQTKASADGYWKKTGPGLRQQLQDSWIEYYNSQLTVNRIKDYLMDIFFSRTNESDRKVVAMTGTLGSMIFHDMLAAEASSFLQVDTNFTRIEQNDPRYLVYGAQYKRYQGPNGIDLTLVLNPVYDDRNLCKRTHPQHPIFPVDSARMTFLDFGNSGTSNNIQMLKVKDTYTWGYVSGTLTPMGPVKGGQAGSTKAGYTMFTSGSAGIMVTDATRCGELVYDFEY